MTDLDKVQHEIDNLYKDMSSTRVRDGLKMSVYESFKQRVKVIGDLLREARQPAEPV